MGLSDKLRGKTQEFEGKAKEAMGKAKGDEAIRRQGQHETSEPDTTQAADKPEDSGENR